MGTAWTMLLEWNNLGCGLCCSSRCCRCSRRTGAAWAKERSAIFGRLPFFTSALYICFSFSFSVCRLEARILGAVLRAESKVQCRFNTAKLSMSQLGSSCPVRWPSALPRLWTFQKPPARAYLTCQRGLLASPRPCAPRSVRGWRPGGGGKEAQRSWWQVLLTSSPLCAHVRVRC